PDHRVVSEPPAVARVHAVAFKHASASPVTTGSIVRAFLLLILLLAVGACEERADVGDIPYAHIVSRALPKIERQTGLTFKELPRIERRSRDEVRMFVMKQLSSDRARAQITGMQSAYQVLGLVPDSLDLADLMQRLL